MNPHRKSKRIYILIQISQDVTHLFITKLKQKNGIGSVNHSQHIAQVRPLRDRQAATDAPIPDTRTTPERAGAGLLARRSHPIMFATRSLPCTLLLGATLLILAACGGPPIPPTPTAAPSPTPTETPTLAPTATPTETPSWTDTPLPTDVPPSTDTLVAPDTTLDLTAESLPVVTIEPGGVITVMITEDQINATLASRFASAPIPNFHDSPVVNLGDGNLEMTMQIVPLKAPAGANPLPTSLTLALATRNGALEIQPTLLSPLNAGVTARQVKLGQALLLQTLNEMVAQAAASSGSLSFVQVMVEPDSIQFSVTKAG